MNIVYRCLKCGWHKENPVYGYIKEKTYCPRCNETLIVDRYDNTNTVADLIEEDEIEQMQLAIRSEGNDTIWKDIETIKSPYARAEERKVFIKAGGIFPLNFEIKT